jgi:prolipoprotein diacylglyceryltransferase
MLVVLDNMGLCACITAAFIRLGNLMNSEIIGKPTDVPWAFIFEKVDSLPRHPGQLYEAIFYLIFFLIIYFVYLKKQRESRIGTVFRSLSEPSIHTKVFYRIYQGGASSF